MNRIEKIINWFNETFRHPAEGDDTKSRRLVQDPETGKINWSEGDKPFEDGPEKDKGPEPFAFEDDEKKGTRMFRPVPSYEPFRKNRFEILFPGIPSYHFNAYSYLGTDIHQEKRLFMSAKVIKDDYSVFRVYLLFPGEIDICEKLVELESKPKVGDITVNLLDPTGVVVKTILIPDCEVTEIRAFRDLEYGKPGDKSDELLYGEIVVKHKQRKLL